MDSKDLILKLSELNDDIRYQKNIAKNGKNKKERNDATDELIHLNKMAENLFKQNKILELTHPHLKPEQHSEWYSGMGIGNGLMHDISTAILKLKEVDS